MHNFHWLDTFIEHLKTCTNLLDAELSSEMIQGNVSFQDLDENEDPDNNENEDPDNDDKDIESVFNISVLPETCYPLLQTLERF